VMGIRLSLHTLLCLAGLAAASSLALNSRTRHSSPSAFGFIGDSITVGSKPFSPPDLVAALLSTGDHHVVAINAGRSGATTAVWLPNDPSGCFAAATAAFARAHVQTVAIMLGSNDARAPYAVAPSTYGAHMRATADALVQEGYRVLLNAPPFAVPGSVAGLITPASDDRLVAYQRQLRQIANGDTIRLGDTTAYAAFRSHVEWLRDGLHPNETGATQLAHAWAAAIVQSGW
jgi:lysophospholipase L1-like esterase